MIHMILEWMKMMITNRDTNQLNVNEFIHQIIYLVKHKEDYIGATRIMIENAISLDDLNDKTMKISRNELAKLADTLIESKK